MSLPLLNKRLTSVAEFHRMGRARIFAPNERVELLEGEIYTMPPIGPSHAGGVNAASEILRGSIAGRYFVSVQNPVQLGDLSEPIPDLALLHWRDDFYRHAHPTPVDILLIVEVADTTVRSDRQHKLPLYARAGIPEVWLVNIPERRLEQYAEPAGDAYRVAHVRQAGETVQSHSLPELRLAVTDILG